MKKTHVDKCKEEHVNDSLKLKGSCHNKESTITYDSPKNLARTAKPSTDYAGSPCIKGKYSGPRPAEVVLADRSLYVLDHLCVLHIFF